MPRESLEKKKARLKTIIRLLKKHYPDPKTALGYHSAHQLLVATILSAQCTDERVNQVTPGLFKKYSSVAAFAVADQQEMEKDIYTTGFYKNKARAIINSAKAIVEQHGGKVPKTLDELVKLPGVGRKTASVVLGAAFGVAEGIVVDTHVGRLSRRLGLTTANDAAKVERDLMNLVPKPDWIAFSHMLILHGRSICLARRPKCPGCFLNPHCPSARL